MGFRSVMTAAVTLPVIWITKTLSPGDGSEIMFVSWRWCLSDQFRFATSGKNLFAPCFNRIVYKVL